MSRFSEPYKVAVHSRPDGSLVACWYRDEQPNTPLKVAIIPFAGGNPIKVLYLPRPSFTSAPGMRWTPAGVR
jgi:hypothetical protein